MTIESREVEPSAVSVVDDVSGLTASWLTQVVRGAGHDGEVTDLLVAPIGTGQMGANYRLTSTFAGDPGDFPATVVAKLPAPDPAGRSMVAPGYLAELTFYRELADTVAVRAPKAHLAIATDAGTEFTLLLEDLAPAVQGDQLAGCSVAAATAAARNVAGLHGPRWCDPTWWDTPCSSPVGDEAIAFMSDLVVGAVGTFLEIVGADWTPAERDLLAEVAAAMPAFMGGRTERFAAVHGDYRLDNLLFGPGDDVVAVDWQTLSIGLPARDVAYLLGTSLRVEDRRAHERSIVEAYHAALVGHGVADYSVDECWDDYRFGMFQCPLINVLGAAFGRRTERGDQMFTAMARRWITALADLDTLALAR
jgi:hypothetical protein